jgi:two-component system, cell cycle sensor histidine kinase and response regulator CckA
MEHDKSISNNHESTSHNEGVIHDVNNMLWAICSIADLIKNEIPKSHACQERAETIVQAALRCSSLLSTSIQTKTQNLEKKEIFDLISLIKEVVSFVAFTPGLKSQTEVTHEKEKVMICGIKSEISSALMNLCLNAIEAMPDGGVLHVNTHCLKNTAISNSTNRNLDEAEEHIIINIIDTGIGIQPEDLIHIFEPHFTTKCSLKKKNLGMGLWRVQQCVSQHEGTIHVSSSPGNGATFSIKLPVVRNLKTKSSKTLACKFKTLKRKKVLIIDNDETIRDVITIMLNKAKIDVIGYSNSYSAITWVSEHIGHASIAIVEHMFPVFDGIKCSKTLQTIDPGLKCILCSDSTDKSTLINHKKIFLTKPFLKNDLFKAINTAITENSDQI